MKRLLVSSVVALVATLSLNMSWAADKNFKLALQNPKGHPLEMGAAKFAELVDSKSNGSMSVKVFAGGVLGGDAQNVSSLQGGTLDMVVLNSGILASQVPDFTVYDFPFMFGSAEEVDKIVDGEFGKALHAKLEDKGIIGLTYWELGFRDMTNSKHPINKVEDIKGLKLRVIPNAINVDWVTALGANPTPLPFPEVYTALEQKAIDGQENPLTVIAANKFYEVQKHLTITHHQYNPQSAIFSKKVWDKLTPEQQTIIRESAIEAGLYERGVAREKSASALEELKTAGMEVTELPPEEVAKMRELMKPIIEKYADVAGKETVDKLQSELATLRK
ncbi:TRAP transporter substrate-binding protein [Thiofilum flexile]|uniref:TRAP transporter substrate-binding protein n=1 Tax=Thiofilum flexile TaxID=125627 RepID=UPI00037EBCDF|nr:DctP family TRAP transporter solute-binding subunit [Thiofilum flexile]